MHKKSQENFERITLRRLIQIKDGHPEVVEIWLAFLKKHAYYGVGMKANVYEHEKLGLCPRAGFKDIRELMQIFRSRQNDGCQSGEPQAST